MNQEEKTAFINKLDAMSMRKRHSYLEELIADKSDIEALKGKLLVIMDEYSFHMSREVFIDTNGDHEAIADLIIKGKVEPSTSNDREHPGIVFRYCYENPEREHLFETDSQLLDRAIEWFGGVIEKSERLTSGNVSHQGATIRAFAKICIEFLNLHRMK